MIKVVLMGMAMLFASASFSATNEVQSTRSFWSCGNVGKSWDRMSALQKCFAAVVIPPGYVVGICYKSIAWLFVERREL